VATYAGDAIDKISKIASELTGVQLGERQRSMVETRLGRRLAQLKLKNLDEYHTYLTENFNVESRALISLLTTHHTFFFREFLHFKFLEDQAFDKLVEVARTRPDKTIRIWSAACSRGQEVYSLAMFFDKLLRERAPDVKYQILGTDVDIESVKWAQNGVYNKNEIKEVPLAYLTNNWARGTGKIADFVKVKDVLKSRCKFEDRNILKLSPSEEAGYYDVIFCRNVLIYFNSDQIKTVVGSLMKRLHPEGHLVVGVSESLLGLGLDVQSHGSSVYSHPKAVEEKKPTPASNVTPMPARTPAVAKDQPVRVLCVDDSKSILVILQKILTKENGFEVVGTALNGLEAKEQVQKLRPDVITMDIHMPEQTGVEYLKANMNSSHPPVVMISSVSREDGELAIKALEYGASDYVEKPTLQTFAQKSDEIQLKLRSAIKNTKMKGLSSFDQAFQRPSGQPQRKDEICVIACGMGEMKKVEKILTELKNLKWPVTTMIFVEGAAGVLPKLASKLSKFSSGPVDLIKEEPGVIPGPGYVGLGDLHQAIGPFAGLRKDRPLAVWVLGGLSKSSQEEIAGLKNAQILLEDRTPAIWTEKDPLKKAATDMMPWNSFVYMTGEYFLKAG
tara:strand:- start:1014 stop:2864 length:1851 start_codon:yes stop_codon:yes gene_type:complete